jgi:hypothetical protein
MSAERAKNTANFSSSARSAAEKGMRQILEQHTPEELAKLCDELGMPDEGLPREDVIRTIFEEELRTVDDYRRILSLMWEGACSKQKRIHWKIRCFVCLRRPRLASVCHCRRRCRRRRCGCGCGCGCGSPSASDFDSDRRPPTPLRREQPTLPSWRRPHKFCHVVHVVPRPRSLPGPQAW